MEDEKEVIVQEENLPEVETAASDAAGRLMLTAKDVERSVLTGTRIHTQAELNEFITSASAEQKAAVGKELGIEDWNTLTVEEFAKKASAYRESGKAEAYKKKAAKVQKMQGLAESKARNIPRAIALADGAVQRYADADSNFAVARDGDTYIVYDYATGNVTRDMTRAEVNAALGRYRRSRAGGEISRSDAENYQKRLSAWDGVTEGFSFVLGDTSAVLKDIEVDGKKIGDKQIRLDATKAKSILKEHSEMDIEVLKSLPKITENPIIALESKTQKGRFVLFGEVTAKNGRPVMVAIELNPKTRSGKTTYLDIIKIASAYTRTNTQNLIDTSKIIYVDKNSDRVTNWLKVNRLQLPLPNQQSNSVNNSIPDSAKKVNTSDEKSAKSLSEMLPMEEKAKPTAKQVKAAMEAKAQAAVIESLAKEKIKDYADLSKENQSMIRKVLREAMASGLTEADALSYARVAARSGLDITFDKEACYKGKNEAGEAVYHAGYYDPDNNRIVVNPEAKKKHASLLIHELSHAVRSYIGKDGKWHAIPMIDDPDKISDAMWEKIEGYYADQEITVERAELMADEASAYYAEQMLGTDAAIDLLLGKKPTLKQKILSFFKQSARDYSTDAALSREARKFLRDFKKTFDAFAARNRGRNIKAGNARDTSARRFAEEDAYSYEVLSKKNDLNVVALTDTIPHTKDGGKLDNKKILEIGKNNARSQNNKNNTATSTYVYVKDIGVDVLIGAKGMQHGLERNDVATAMAVMKIGDILKNSIAVNEMNASVERKTEMSYVLLAACELNGADYVVRSVVSKEDNTVNSFSLYKLGAVKGKKIENPNPALKRGAAVTEHSSLISSDPLVISITDFLENVKSISLVNEVFSADVAKKLGISRFKGSLATSLRYAMEDIDPAAVALPRKAGTMSVGQYKKRVADLMKTKSYSKDQIYDIVKKLPMASEAMEKTREQVAEAIWQIYNEDLTAGERREAAHDISEFLVARLMTEAKEENPKAAEANEAIAYLRTGIGRLAFSPEDRAEILHNVDKDGWRRILGRWGFKGKRNKKTLDKRNCSLIQYRKMPRGKYMKNLQIPKRRMLIRRHGI